MAWFSKVVELDKSCYNTTRYKIPYDWLTSLNKKNLKFKKKPLKLYLHWLFPINILILYKKPKYGTSFPVINWSRWLKVRYLHDNNFKPLLQKTLVCYLQRNCPLHLSHETWNSKNLLNCSILVTSNLFLNYP